ncbi:MULTISPECIES: DUF4430 domain-containing protein [unclassified Bacillus (in: firmicutes)]|uniref:DUF4430 domain-containing protein n=1 Tax=unclassified Bacillus (in: firmicutes) TaxID=185979 RepID=UPI0008DF83F2|nr:MULTISPECIES: DUF4430 domain-containing protein [unclassified Bacillus (in: firmicutes)]SFB13500.1 protein of unknown function [Bacillus sp. UNCCL13]SFQ90000.1 protein of unknown function [Bacillus sp. cl95]
MQRWMKFAAIILAIVLCFNLAGCSSEAEKGHISEEKKMVSKVEESEEKNKDEKKTEATSPAKDSPVSEAPAKTEATENKETTSVPDNTTVQSKPAAQTAKQPAPATAPTKQQPTTQQPATTTPTPTQKPAAKPAAPEMAVTVSIVGPSDRGTILGATKVTFKEGATVLDVLVQLTGKRNIQLDYSGSGATAYVAGIDNIYEFDYGAKSGWIGKLNGTSLGKSAGTVKVKDGDSIQWLYTEK